jgi:DNA invertase Pin-like site-specific DNA recombinase
MSDSIEHLDFDPDSFAEHVSRLSLAMSDLEAAIRRTLEPSAGKLLAGLAAAAAEFRRQERRRELRRKRERRRRRQQAGRRR